MFEILAQLAIDELADEESTGLFGECSDDEFSWGLKDS